jgi:outer membrane protein assembly factor BamB
MKKKNIFFLALGTFLPSCTPSKEPLSGKREDFLPIPEVLKTEKKLSTVPISIPPSTTLKAWKQANGNATHYLESASLLPKDFKNIWSYAIGCDQTYERYVFLSPPIASDAIVYAANGCGQIEGRNIENGHLEASFSTNLNKDQKNSIGSAMAIEGTTLYVTTSVGDLIAFDTITKKKKFSHHLKIPFQSSPTVANNMVFAVNMNNELFAFDAQTGKKKWSYQGLCENTLLMGSSSPAYHHGIVIATFSSGQVVALEGTSGQIIWSDTITSAPAQNSCSTINHIKANPVVDAENVYVISYSNRLVSYDYHTGEKNWEKNIGGINTPCVTKNEIFLIDNASNLIALDKKRGDAHWIVSLNEHNENKEDDKKNAQWFGPLLTSHGLVVTNSYQDGKLIKKISLDTSFYLSPILVDGKILALGDQASLWAVG